MSGTDNSRPQYQSMLAAAARGEIDVLLLDDLSRLSRDQVESEQVIRRLEFQSVRIISVSDGYDSHTKTATRKIQRGVKNLINEMRLDELRERVHRGLTGQAMKHLLMRRCQGSLVGVRGREPAISQELQFVTVADASRRGDQGLVQSRILPT